MKTITMTIEVNDTSVDFQIEDDATDADIEDQANIEAQYYVNVVEWTAE